MGLGTLASCQATAKGSGSMSLIPSRKKSAMQQTTVRDAPAPVAAVESTPLDEWSRMHVSLMAWKVHSLLSEAAGELEHATDGTTPNDLASAQLELVTHSVHDGLEAVDRLRRALSRH